MNLTNNAERLLEYLASCNYSASTKDIYNALHINKAVLLESIDKLTQCGLKVTVAINSKDILSVRIKKTRAIKRYLDG